MEVCETKYTLDIAKALNFFNQPAFYLRIYLQQQAPFSSDFCVMSLFKNPNKRYYVITWSGSFPAYTVF